MHSISSSWKVSGSPSSWSDFVIVSSKAKETKLDLNEGTNYLFKLGSLECFDIANITFKEFLRKRDFFYPRLIYRNPLHLRATIMEQTNYSGIKCSQIAWTLWNWAGYDKLVELSSTNLITQASNVSDFSALRLAYSVEQVVSISPVNVIPKLNVSIFPS